MLSLMSLSAISVKAEVEYRIGVDDIISINVWRNPELSIDVPVRPDGKVSMPLVGDVRAGGLTPAEVAKSIENKLRTYIRDPRVAVIVTDLVSHEYLSRVRVTGAVATPTSLPYRQGMTVLDVILEAGGVTEFASENKTKLYRKVDGKTEIYKIRLKDILRKGKLDTNIPLEPGDVVTVPESVF
jgi:polysaccharide export outer membrane protein